MSDRKDEREKMEQEGPEPFEIAQAYLDERLPESGWRVEEVSGNIDFAMVSVVLGRYLRSGDIERREAGAEGRGTTIQAAVDDALGSSER